MKRAVEIRGGLLVRNTALNIAGQVLPLVVGLLSIPIIVRELGPERFGLLSLVWVALGFFGNFDLGMGQAITKFVAEYLGQEKELPHLVWAAVWISGLVGVLEGAILVGLVPLLTERVFDIPPDLIDQAQGAFYVLALCLPIVLVFSILRGVLEACQRFDLVNAVRVPASASLFLIPAIAAPLGVDLTGIVWLLTLARLSATIAYSFLVMQALPVLRQNFCFKLSGLRPLLTYSGWVALATIVGPLIYYLDRFLIGSVLTVTALSYYTVPYELTSRLWVIPGSLSMTLFPASSTLGASSAREDLERIYARSVKYLLLIMAPLTVALVMFAETVLRLWVGLDFAQNSVLVLQILAIGALFNALGSVPYSFLMGLGYPEVRSKLLLVELPFYAILGFSLVRSNGIQGMALARVALAAIDVLVFFVACWRLLSFSPRLLAENGVMKALLTFCGFLLVGASMRSVLESVAMQAVVMGILSLIFAVVTWYYVLDVTDKVQISYMFGGFRAFRSRYE